MFSNNSDSVIDAGPEMLTGVDDADDYSSAVDEVEPEYAERGRPKRICKPNSRYLALDYDLS